MNFDIKTKKELSIKDKSIVINLGDKLELPDGTFLNSLSSGLFKNIKIEGDKLLKLEIGDNLEVTEEIANFCRENWTQVYDIFPYNEFKNADFYRSPKTKVGDLELNFWYCGVGFSCGIHNKHDFYEVHTQILGQGKMEKFHTDQPDSLYFQEILSPGQTHAPFYDKDGNYPTTSINPLLRAFGWRLRGLDHFSDYSLSVE